MNKGRRQVESSIHYSRRVIWTNHNVLQINKFTYNIPDHDEWDSIESYQYWEDGEFHRWCNYWYRERGRTWQVGRRDGKKVSGEWLVCKTREVQVEG